MNNKVIKLISIGASFIGAAAAVVGSWATAKQTDEKMRFLFLIKHWVQCPHRCVVIYPLVSHYVGASPLIPPCNKRKIVGIHQVE